MKILGVDPGLSGALAVLEIGAEDVRVLEIIDVPVLGNKTKQSIDVISVQQFLLNHGPQHCIFERARSMPRQGVASTFRYGVATGMLFATVMLCAIPVISIDPGEWKRKMRLGRDKQLSRQRALEVLPSGHEYFKRRRDHNRAEAALLALYGARTRLMATAKAAISEFTGRPAT